MNCAVRQLRSVAEVTPAAWNRLNAGGYPFLRHEFLLALEQTGCVGAGTGWHTRHLLAEGDGLPIGAMPLYLKQHSMGEFVFDFAWAEAYQRAGRHYYPKLVSAVPFTPVAGPRLLTADTDDDAKAAVETRLLRAACTQVDREGLSSLHVLFPDRQARDAMAAAGLLLRKACQFRWHNAGYASFDDYIGAMSAAKRKKIRRERRRVAEQGIEVQTLTGAALDPDRWHEIYPLYASTFALRGRAPYMTQAFFEQITRTMSDQLIVSLAHRHGRLIAAAILFADGDLLYGRHWGADADYHSLHFELCYYQGIDYCIAHGLRAFDPGTQGEHKLARGFLPHYSWSAHYLADPAFSRAVADFLQREQPLVEYYAQQMTAHGPFRDRQPPTGE